MKPIPWDRIDPEIVAVALNCDGRWWGYKTRNVICGEYYWYHAFVPPDQHTAHLFPVPALSKREDVDEVDWRTSIHLRPDPIPQGTTLEERVKLLEAQLCDKNTKLLRQAAALLLITVPFCPEKKTQEAFQSWLREYLGE